MLVLSGVLKGWGSSNFTVSTNRLRWQASQAIWMIFDFLIFAHFWVCSNYFGCFLAKYAHSFAWAGLEPSPRDGPQQTVSVLILPNQKASSSESISSFWAKVPKSSSNSRSLLFVIRSHHHRQYIGMFFQHALQKVFWNLENLLR